ncbi:MAG: glycosyltransferase [Pseudomonadota bacterium]|nr:glycosyltransferase [Pseudomonadota bacterium]
MTRRLLFHRDFHQYTGGHGKVWDYFSHARVHPEWSPAIYLTPGSVDQYNPWRVHPVPVEREWRPESASVLFLAGLDWSAHSVDEAGKPVINLIQHVRHADPADSLHRHLSRRAIRICVSQAVADAICSTGLVNGPVRVIPAAIDLLGLPEPAPMRHGIFIGAIKQPELGRALAARLREQGRDVKLVDAWVPREHYLALMARSRVAVVLPLPSEGFFLPGLEAMALGCATVVPDCIGNREYLRPAVNALAPPARLDALVDAISQLDDARYTEVLISAGKMTAATFGLETERARFHAVLDQVDRLWEN